MIDYFALGITHVMMALVALRLARRKDLDSDSPFATSEEGAGSRDSGRDNQGGLRRA